jgi:type IV secretory pathway VirB10-like protein
MTLFLLALLLQGTTLEIKPPAAPDAASAILVPAGTVIPVNLTSRISTKHAKDGDGIYAQTAVPIAINDQIAIPQGSFIKGKISHVQQPGRVRGRAELTLTFQTLVLPTGKSIEIYANLAGTGGSVERKGEATVVADKGNDAEEILTKGAEAGAGGAVTGAVWRGAHGAAEGAAIGAGAGAAGAAIVALIKKGAPLTLEPGTMIEIVLNRPIQRDPGNPGTAASAPQN